MVGNSQSTVDIAERWGVKLISPLSKYKYKSSTTGHQNEGNILWKANHWDEIDQLLLLIESHSDGDEFLSDEL